jgi:hypothetical protein
LGHQLRYHSQVVASIQRRLQIAVDGGSKWLKGRSGKGHAACARLPFSAPWTLRVVRIVPRKLDDIGYHYGESPYDEGKGKNNKKHEER